MRETEGDGRDEREAEAEAKPLRVEDRVREARDEPLTVKLPDAQALTRVVALVQALSVRVTRGERDDVALPEPLELVRSDAEPEAEEHEESEDEGLADTVLDTDADLLARARAV